MSDGTDGNCFQVAGDSMLDAPASARLVHGLPIGRGVANAGQRFCAVHVLARRGAVSCSS